MPRDSRSRSARRSRPYEKRRSGRESSRPRRSPRERSSAGHTSRFEAPSSWNETSTHWDTRTEYGLNFPKRVESTQFSRKQGLAGQDITEVKVIDLIQSGLSNWGLRLVANGRFVSCEFFRNRIEATFATHLLREVYKNKESVDFNKLLTSFIPEGQDPNEWDSKLTGIKGLVASIIDHFRTIAPVDPNQKIMEQLEALQAENAALKASQATTATPPHPPSAQPNIVPLDQQSSLPSYFAKAGAAPHPPHTSQPAPSAPSDPLDTYKRKEATPFFSVHVPESGSDAKVKAWVKKYVPSERQSKLTKVISELKECLRQFEAGNSPNLEPILSDWGVSSQILAKCNIDAQIRLLAAVQLLRN